MNVGTWNNKEKELYEIGIEKYGAGRWKQISNLVKTRDMLQVKNYARSLLLKNSSPKKGKKKGAWTKEEIRLFWKGVKDYGAGAWFAIAETIPTRDVSQVKGYGTYHCYRHGKVKKEFNDDDSCDDTAMLSVTSTESSVHVDDKVNHSNLQEVKPSKEKKDIKKEPVEILCLVDTDLSDVNLQPNSVDIKYAQEIQEYDAHMIKTKKLLESKKLKDWCYFLQSPNSTKSTPVSKCWSAAENEHINVNKDSKSRARKNKHSHNFATKFNKRMKMAEV